MNETDVKRSHLPPFVSDRTAEPWTQTFAPPVTEQLAEQHCQWCQRAMAEQGSSTFNRSSRTATATPSVTLYRYWMTQERSIFAVWLGTCPKCDRVHWAAAFQRRRETSEKIKPLS